jgi:acetyl esterase/lipase
MSLRLRLLRPALRWVVRRRLASESSVPAARARLERHAARYFRPPRDVRYLDDRLVAIPGPDGDPAAIDGDGSGLPVVWASAGQPSRHGVLLYFHGGAYVMGSPQTHRHLAASIGARAGIRAILPAYRLAPEHPFPSAQHDALMAWRLLRASGYAAHRIAVAGDSAGGGLALSLLGMLDAAGEAPPACVIALSPWTDLAMTGASAVANARSDVMLPVERVAEVAQMCLPPGGDPHDPRFSPLNAGFRAPPPVLIQASRSEILRDDAIRMAGVLSAAGGDVELQLWRDTPHGWQVFHGHLPEADRAIDGIARFIVRHIPRDGPTTGKAGKPAGLQAGMPALASGDTVPRTSR